MKPVHNKNRGFLLLEALVSVTVMCAMLAAIAGGLNQSVQDVQLAGEYTVAVSLVQKTLQTLETNQQPWMTNPFTYEINHTHFHISWTSSMILPGLQASQAFAYWEKRGRTYSVQAETYHFATP